MKKLQDQLMEVVRDLEKVARRIDRITKRVDKFQKPKRTRAVELSQIPKIDPAILARVIRGKIYPTDIIFGHIIANPDGIDINTLAKITGFKNEQIKQIILSLRQEGKIKGKLKEGLRGKAYAAGMSRSLYFEA
ncbi:MAG: hypothetical protein H8E19_12440 [Deltaproteobacteria bacterium]|uniref:Uncharacterized protein n=1 Tax=Candidatus Desulfacyla euxinica TaxID=2841693 RepID=A0A8J6T3T4_9DELT|nr:hypothetical protein [Candidatus Desulfacyla euxinica]MBL7217708.1 hypothetical protein [Desulfobacteraceae bacterium]